MTETRGLFPRAVDNGSQGKQPFSRSGQQAERDHADDRKQDAGSFARREPLTDDDAGIEQDHQHIERDDGRDQAGDAGLERHDDQDHADGVRQADQHADAECAPVRPRVCGRLRFGGTAGRICHMPLPGPARREKQQRSRTEHAGEHRVQVGAEHRRPFAGQIVEAEEEHRHESPFRAVPMGEREVPRIPDQHDAGDDQEERRRLSEVQPLVPQQPGDQHDDDGRQGGQDGDDRRLAGGKTAIHGHVRHIRAESHLDADGRFDLPCLPAEEGQRQRDQKPGEEDARKQNVPVKRKRREPLIENAAQTERHCGECRIHEPHVRRVLLERSRPNAAMFNSYYYITGSDGCLPPFRGRHNRLSPLITW